jgi:hypothetical protein
MEAATALNPRQLSAKVDFTGAILSDWAVRWPPVDDDVPGSTDRSIDRLPCGYLGVSRSSCFDTRNLGLHVSQAHIPVPLTRISTTPPAKRAPVP